MPKAIFLSKGNPLEVDVAEGTSLMRAAASAGVPGILGDCGGQLSCATCHVVFEPASAQRLPPVSDAEDQMLDFTAMPREPYSRLSCQIVMTPSLDGIRVRVADPQQ